jgi:hypothetical protein
MKHLTVVLLAAVLAQGQALAAEVYTWKDKNGRVHYSDQPHADATAKPMTMADPSGGVGQTQSEVNKADQNFKEQQAKQSGTDKQAADEAARKAARDAYCSSLQNRITTFERGGRIVVNQGTERVFLSDDQIASELGKMKAQQAKDCK